MKMKCKVFTELCFLLDLLVMSSMVITCYCADEVRG